MQVDIVNNVGSKILFTNGGHKLTYNMEACSDCTVLIDQVNGAAAASMTVNGVFVLCCMLATGAAAAAVTMSCFYM